MLHPPAISVLALILTCELRGIVGVRIIMTLGDDGYCVCFLRVAARGVINWRWT